MKSGRAAVGWLAGWLAGVKKQWRKLMQSRTNRAITDAIRRSDLDAPPTFNQVLSTLQ